MAYSRIGVVTGANKGIGLAIVRQLALQYPKSFLGSNGGSFLIYLTSRDETRGQDALARLRNDEELKNAKALVSDGGLTEVKYHALDIADPDSIKGLAYFLKNEHPDGIDFAINNAGIAMQGFDLNVVKTTIRTNYHGTLEATRAWIPLLKPGGRITNVASNSGSLHHYPAALKKRFVEAETVDDATALMEEFASAVADGDHERRGFPSAAYAVSKAGEIAQTRAVARELRARGGGLVINSCHPGWVVTDMTRGRGTKTADQGAQTPVLLSIGDIGGATGEYWSDEEARDWAA